MSAQRCAGDARSHSYDSTGKCERCGKPNALPTPEQLDWVEIPGHPGSYLPRAEYEQATRPHTTHQRAITEYEQLTAAAAIWPPPCVGDARYIADELPLEDRVEMQETCMTRCTIRDQCSAYFDRARPTAGIWAGMFFFPRPPAEPTHRQDTP